MSADLMEATIATFGEALDRLPLSGSDMEAIESALAQAQAELPWPRLHTVLLERVSEVDSPRDRLALVLHATDPDVAGAARGKGDLAAVFEVLVAAADARALDRFVQRVHQILETLPAARDDLPNLDRLIEISEQIEADHEGSADALVTLAQVVEDLEEVAREAADAEAAAREAAPAEG